MSDVPDISPIIREAGQTFEKMMHAAEKVVETGAAKLHENFTRAEARELEGAFRESLGNLENGPVDNGVPDLASLADKHARPDTPYRDGVADALSTQPAASNDQRKK